MIYKHNFFIYNVQKFFWPIFETNAISWLWRNFWKPILSLCTHYYYITPRLETSMGPNHDAFKLWAKVARLWK